jgi:hypothetical protein
VVHAEANALLNKNHAQVAGAVSGCVCLCLLCSGCAARTHVIAATTHTAAHGPLLLLLLLLAVLLLRRGRSASM